MYRLFQLFWAYNLPRWSILFIDTFICAFALTVAFLLRFNFDNIPEADAANFLKDYIIVLSVRFITFIISKTYKGVVRYTSSRDAVRIFLVILIGSFTVFVFNLIDYFFISNSYFIPNSVIIIDGLVSLFLMISSRLAVKALYSEIKNPSKEKHNVVIFGAGEAGLITKYTLDRDASIRYKVIGFIDDDEKKKGRSLEGVFVYHSNELKRILQEFDVEFLIISTRFSSFS